MACTSIPAHNPAVPFLGKFHHPLHPGSKIRIGGMMTQGGDERFVINLQSGPITNPRDDTALHLSIRPRDQTIVRNTYTNKQWGAEERSGHCPIIPGRPYDIEIAVRLDCFAIFVNGRHYYKSKIRRYTSLEGDRTRKCNTFP
ncbi:unnamed protein product [Hermetia illucens]|uniref:Galectin n=1 Tax=Hermetia illucens TaxID=343691 RepID=A0A7R8UWX3_HERIL|nr:unnamed protein product [Hermetia illucens]